MTRLNGSSVWSTPAPRLSLVSDRRLQHLKVARFSRKGYVEEALLHAIQALGGVQTSANRHDQECHANSSC